MIYISRPLPRAKIQYWDNTSISVLCPYCDEIHRHGFTISDYPHKTRRLSHCYPPCGQEYSIKFLFDSPDFAFKIDKENVRFVVGGARLPERVLDEDESDRWTTQFKDRVNRKRLWTEATETVRFSIGSDHHKDVKKISLVESDMVTGNVSSVRYYLETSTEVDLFVNGVKAWEPPQFSDTDEDDNRDRGEEDEVVSEEPNTSGKTALIIVACEAHPEMVKLLINKGADVNAADLDGKTALIKAALWGRLNNVEILLQSGADPSMQCIYENRLWRAVDFALPLRANTLQRKHRAGGVYKEDAFERAMDRNIIVQLLAENPRETVQPRVDSFAFQSSALDRTSLSLTTYYSLPSVWKTVARLHRGGGLPEITAMSGWAHDRNQSIQIAGRDWTEEVLRLCAIIQYTSQPVPSYDQGTPGRYNACHAEKQLIAYFVYKHLFLNYETSASEVDEIEETADFGDIENRLQNLDLGHSNSQNLTHNVAERVAYKARLKHLSEQIPPQHFLKSALVISSRDICTDCHAFISRVNSVWDLQLQLQHRCLEISCGICPR